MTPEQKQRQIEHDFANEGDCTVCGDLAHLIAEGLVKPCFEWERVGISASHRYEAEPIPEPTESKTPLVTPWEGC